MSARKELDEAMDEVAADLENLDRDQLAATLNAVLSVLPRVLFKMILVEHDRWADGKPRLTLPEIEQTFHASFSEAFEEAGGTLPVVDYPRELAAAKQLLADAYDGFGTDAHGFPNGDPTNSWRAKVEQLGAWPRPENADRKLP
jgi:hypothetical protein